MKLGDVITQAPVKRCGDGSYPVLSMTMHDGIVEQKDRFKKAIASKDTKPYKVVYPGQLVVGFPIDEGVIYTQNYDFAGIMSPAYSVWNIDKSRVNPAYLELALHSPRSMAYYAAKMRGTTARRRSITPDSLRELTIPLPAIEEQQDTLRVFNTVKAAQIACNAYYAKLDQLIKSRFVEMFGDPCNSKSSNLPSQPIHAFCELRIGPFGSALHKGDYISGGHPIINPSHIVKDRLQPDANLTISESKYAFMQPYHLHIGDVVLGRRGEIGRCAIVDTEGLLCGTGSMILRPNSTLCRSDYLQRVISFPSFALALEQEAVGVTMKNLNAKIVGNASIILPPLELQQQFADFVAEVDKLRFVDHAIAIRLKANSCNH